MSKTLHKAKAVKELKSKMALTTAKRVKGNLEALDPFNEVNHNLPETDSLRDLQRFLVVNRLRKNLKDVMVNFNRVRENISTDYRETIQRRYCTVTGENPNEDTVDLLISTGESEPFFKKSIQEQGLGKILDTINEIQERHDAVKDIEKSLNELHQVFLDMAVLVKHHGAQLYDIEGNVKRANSLVPLCLKNKRDWSLFAVLLSIIIFVLVLLVTVKPWENDGNGGGSG